ncbi:unnamed protein product [Rhizoctonia solani]|uniref:Uncharacterized protein n=1 Tax=Rhizoctonia solani TaxID=456999 RepID=A0A8H3CH95_9AGAM|nr:unnamed protein product [Rhizoctonia solani]
MSKVNSTPGVNHPAAGASSVGGAILGTHEPRKKTTSLWSYILPLTNTHEINTHETPLPATSPSDRNAVSIRLLLGDTQAAVQRLSDRVDRVLDQQRQEAKHLEHTIGGLVQSVQRVVAAVAESNAAHTSKLDETLNRCSAIEAALSAQSKAISQLSAKCDSNLSQTLDRLGTTHDHLLGLLPSIPMLQAIPSEIQNSQLVITSALKSSQNPLLSAEMKTCLAEHRVATSASLDKLREELTRGLDTHREAWSGALSLHRQEMNALFSAVLAGIRTGPGSSTGTASVADSTTVGHDLSEDHASTGQGRGSGTSQTAQAPNTTHTFSTTTHEPHGPPSSSSFVTIPQVEHAARNSNASSRHTQASPVHDKNSTQSEVLARVEDTQSTALSSVPDESQPESMTFEQRAGRGFGALSKRAGSAFGSFTNPGSPVFVVQRRPFVQGSTLQPAPSLAKGKTNESLTETGSSALQSGIPDTRSSTLGRSSPGENAPSSRLTLKKRAAGVEDAPPGPTKRSRKTKTRVLMNSQELTTLDSSPER